MVILNTPLQVQNSSERVILRTPIRGEFFLLGKIGMLEVVITITLFALANQAKASST
jgi:hypothetical protein